MTWTVRIPDVPGDDLVFRSLRLAEREARNARSQGFEAEVVANG